MRWMEGLGWILLAALFTGITAFPARAQTVSYSEKLLIHADRASSWIAGNASVVEVQGPVAITMDNVKCSADQAVIWLTPSPGGLLAEQQADIVLARPRQTRGERKPSDPNGRHVAGQRHRARNHRIDCAVQTFRGSLAIHVVSASPGRPQSGQFINGGIVHGGPGPGRRRSPPHPFRPRPRRRDQRIGSRSARCRRGQRDQVPRSARTGN